MVKSTSNVWWTYSIDFITLWNRRHQKLQKPENQNFMKNIKIFEWILQASRFRGIDKHSMGRNRYGLITSTSSESLKTIEIRQLSRNNVTMLEIQCPDFQHIHRIFKADLTLTLDKIKNYGPYSVKESVQMIRAPFIYFWNITIFENKYELPRHDTHSFFLYGFSFRKWVIITWAGAQWNRLSQKGWMLIQSHWALMLDLY